MTDSSATRAAIAAPRSPKRQRRGLSAAPSGEQRPVIIVRTRGRNVSRCYSPASPCNSASPVTSADRRSARRRCALEKQYRKLSSNLPLMGTVLQTAPLHGQKESNNLATLKIL